MFGCVVNVVGVNFFLPMLVFFVVVFYPFVDDVQCGYFLVLLALKVSADG